MDDTYGSSSSFESMAQFLHEDFFPGCDWAPMVLNPQKSMFFWNQIVILGLTGDRHGLCPNDRKLKAIREYLTPQNFEEVEQFLYLTLYLRRYISGRVEHTLILKTSLQEYPDGTAQFVWEPHIRRFLPLSGQQFSTRPVPQETQNLSTIWLAML